MSRLRRFAHGALRLTQVSWRERLLLAEASLLLGLSSLAIRLLPFRRVAQLAGRDRGTPAAPGPEEAVAPIRWAVSAAGRFAPWSPVCFQHGLAAHWMLRRRGLASTLYYGASSDPARGLIAHVWIKSGETPVIGCEEAGRYAVLAAFPAPPTPAP